MTGDVLEGVRVKLQRAETHLRDLQGLDRTHAKPVSHEHNAEATEHRFRLDVPAVVDDQVSAIVGDCLHNLRCALDHLAGQLAIANGGTADESKFPIHLDPLNQNDNPWDHTRHCPCDTLSLALIEKYQPYHRPEPATDPLWLLAQMNNTDKHRQLLLTYRNFGVYPQSWHTSLKVPNPAVSLVASEPEDGGVVLTLTFSQPVPDLQLDPGPSVDICVVNDELDASAYYKDYFEVVPPITEVLNGILRHIRDRMLPEFAALL